MFLFQFCQKSFNKKIHNYLEEKKQRGSELAIDEGIKLKIVNEYLSAQLLIRIYDGVKQKRNITHQLRINLLYHKISN